MAKSPRETSPQQRSSKPDRLRTTPRVPPRHSPEWQQYQARKAEAKRRKKRLAQRVIDRQAEEPALSPRDQMFLEQFAGDLDRAQRLGTVFQAAKAYFHARARENAFTANDILEILEALLEYYATEVDPTTYPPASLQQPASKQLLMPAKPKEFWAQRDLNLRENPPQFIRRVYEKWLGQGLARKDLAQLDPDLYKALSVWLSRHPEDDLAQVLPPQSDVIDDIISRLSAEYPLEVLRKLGYAIDARLRRV